MKNLDYLDKYRLRDYERKFYGGNGDSYNGVFKIFIDGKSFLVIASNGGGWEHVSVSKTGRCPTWEEMCAVKDMFFEAEECVIEYHPPKSNYVNICDHCLHLWKPLGVEIPMPPMIYV